MYTATYSLKNIGTFDTFKDAFKAIYDAINTAKSGGIPLMVLAEMTWIEENGRFAASFFDARDRMCREGYLVGGK